jgi:hypothetical protein
MTIKKHDQIIKQVYRIWAHYLGQKLINTTVSANQITISRIFLVILISACILNESYPLKLVGAILLIVFSFFDALDGSVAIMKNQRSVLGTWLDPMIDRIGFLMIFIVMAYYLSFISVNYIYLTFYTLIMFYFRGLIGADIRLKDKFLKLREPLPSPIITENNNGKEDQKSLVQKSILRRIHLQISPHTHNVALYLSIGLVLRIENLIMIYLALYISLWYLWENYKVISRALLIDNMDNESNINSSQ